MTKALFAVVAMIAFLWTPQARPADSPTVAGKWHFVLDTQGGDRESESTFEQNAGKVTGKWLTADSGKKDGDAVSGTFDGKELLLEFPIDSEIGPGTMKLKGQLTDESTLTGTWAFSGYDGSFKATRVKGESAK